MSETIEYIKQKINGFTPEIGMVLGSGLGELADAANGIRIPFCEIPGFETPTVEGHKGSLVFARIEGKNCVFMQGRYHFYEGHSLSKITYPIRVLKQLGIKTLILTNAAGAVNLELQSGDLMIIEDHLNLMGSNPLIGKNDDTFGVRFPDMSKVYNKDLIEIAHKAGQKLDIDLKQGIYAATTGPSYETPAEVRMLRTLGADACGMSTVPEAIIANHAGIKVLGISCITNMAAGIEDKQLSHDEVVESASIVKDKFENLILNIVKNIS